MKKMKLLTKHIALALVFSTLGCKSKTIDIIAENTSIAESQYTRQISTIEDSVKVLSPRSVDTEGKIAYVPITDWTSGFFSGSLWYIYKLTENKKWLPLAEKFTERLDSAKHITFTHDVGFIIASSYINGYRQTANEKYKAVIMEAALSLSTRYRPKAGVLQSWDVDKGWQSERGWKCPVIIDNMMNLELLFEATMLSGDSTFYKIAISHANNTLKNHFRDDNSCYHVVDYDPITGEVRKKETAQGFSNESSWARGQAWAIYGFTVCYRYTHNIKYLEEAQKMYDFIFTNLTLPNDLVPYWDYNAPNIPNEPRDASAAAITASALYEMVTYLPTKKYKETADKIIETLSKPDYRSEIGTNCNFILKHSVGSIPHNQEINVALIYADYYFLEALSRKKNNNILTQSL